MQAYIAAYYSATVFSTLARIRTPDKAADRILPEGGTSPAPFS
jgi:hypothetical protein